MTEHSSSTNLAGARVQSPLLDQTQQGHTYVPGKESKQSRAERVKKAIQSVEEKFPNTPSAQDHPSHSDMTEDLNGVGQQFQDYDHQ